MVLSFKVHDTKDNKENCNELRPMTIVAENLFVCIPGHFNDLIVFIFYDNTIIFVILSSKSFEQFFFFQFWKLRWVNWVFLLFGFRFRIRFFLEDWSWLLAIIWVWFFVFVLIFFLCAINIDFIDALKFLENRMLKKLVVGTLGSNSSWVHNDNSISHMDEVNSMSH